MGIKRFILAYRVQTLSAPLMEFVMEAGRTRAIRVRATELNYLTGATTETMLDLFCTVTERSEPALGWWLTDGRGVVDIKLDEGFRPYYPIPSRRSLTDILRDAIQHGVDNPSHGVDCACMDQWSRELKTQLYPLQGPGGWSRDSGRYEALRRIRVLLSRMGRL